MQAQLSRRVAAAFQTSRVLLLDADERFALMNDLRNSTAQSFTQLPNSIQQVVNDAEKELAALTAAARDDKRDGAMIALVPREAEQFALPDFEPADELHVTLFYLGDAVDITPTQINELVAQLVQDVRTSARSVPIFARAFGVAHWNPESDHPAWVLNVGDAARDDPSGLEALRESVEQSVNGVGITYPAQHSPWQPHICIAYSKDDLYAELSSRLGPVTFDTLRVAWGEYDIDIPLTVDDVVVANAAGTEALHLSGKHNQKSHGNRAGKKDNTPGKTSKHARSDAENTRSGPADIPVATRPDSSKFDARVERAAQGAAVFEQTPFKSAGSRALRNLMDDDENINGTPYDDIRSALNVYAGNGYKEINGNLRASEGADVTEQVRAIDSVLNLAPLIDDVMVWRGVSTPSKIFGDAWSSNENMSGLEWIDYGFTSTSAKEESTGVFTRSGDDFVKMRILVPGGVKGMGIGDSDREIMQHEAELLLERGLRYRIVSDRRTTSGERILDVEVVR